MVALADSLRARSDLHANQQPQRWLVGSKYPTSTGTSNHTLIGWEQIPDPDLHQPATIGWLVVLRLDDEQVSQVAQAAPRSAHIREAAQLVGPGEKITFGPWAQPHSADISCLVKMRSRSVGVRSTSSLCTPPVHL